MMPGVKGLRKIQLGRETNAGTAVAATTVWRGVGTLQDDRQVVFVPEDIGLAVPTDRAYIPQLGASITFDEMPATYEQLFHVFEAGIKTIGTGTTDGGTSAAIIYNYALPTTAAPTIKTYTIEQGDDAGAERLEYGFVESFTLAGEQGGPLNLTANWRGRQAAVNAFTAGQTAPTVEDILFSKGILAIDAIGGTFGGTAKSNTLLGLTFNCTTGWIASPPGDGNLYFMFAKYSPTQFMMEAQITFEHETSSIAQKVIWRAGTAQKIQLKFTGGATGGAGGTYSVKTLILNLVGLWTNFSKLDERNGNDILTGTFRVGYDATPASAGQILLVNTIATVP
jgi:hypothetical protein